MAGSTLENESGAPAKIDRGAAFMNALATQRNRALDDLAVTGAELAMARQRIAELEAEVKALRPKEEG